MDLWGQGVNQDVEKSAIDVVTPVRPVLVGALAAQAAGVKQFQPLKRRAFMAHDRVLGIGTSPPAGAGHREIW